MGIQISNFLSLFLFILLLFVGIITEIYVLVLSAVILLLARKFLNIFLQEKLGSDAVLRIRICYVGWISIGVGLHFFPSVIDRSKDSILILLTFLYLLKTVCKTSNSKKIISHINILALIVLTFSHVFFMSIILADLSIHYSNTVAASFFIAIWIVSTAIEFLRLFRVIFWKNLLEDILIDVGCLLLGIFYFTDYFREEWLTFVEASLILLCALVLIIALHDTVAPLHFMMLHMVFKSFCKAIAAFSVAFYAYAIFFHVVFKKTELVTDFETKIDGLELIKSEQKEVNPFKEISKAFLKVFFMTTGEYSVEAFVLKWYHVWIFLAFAATTIVIYNLITGLALDDVQEIRRESRRLTLMKNVKFLIEISSFFKDIYEKRIAEKR